MVAGFQSFNDYGSVLIDDTDFNLVLTAKGTLNSGNYNPGIGTDPAPGGGDGGGVSYDTNFSYIKIEAPGSFPIIAVRGPANTPIFPLFVYQGGDGNLFSVFFLQGTAVRPVDYWIFDRVPVADPTLPTFGLVVRNPAGQVVYHSSAKAFRLVQMLTLAKANNNVAVPIDAARRYAVAFNAPHLGYWSDSTRQKVGGFEITAGAAAAYYRDGNYYSKFPGSNAAGNTAPAMLVDVTDY